MSAAFQYKEWCLYLFEHGKVQQVNTPLKEIKYMFGVPLRLKSPYILTPETPAVLDVIQEELQSMKTRWGPVHGLNLMSRANSEFKFDRDVAQASFVGGSEVIVSILVSQCKSVTKVHATSLLYASYWDWLCKQKDLVLVQLILAFSVVYTTKEEEVRVREQLLLVEDAQVEDYDSRVRYDCETEDAVWEDEIVQVEYQRTRICL